MSTEECGTDFSTALRVVYLIASWRRWYHGTRRKCRCGTAIDTMFVLLCVTFLSRLRERGRSRQRRDLVNLEYQLRTQVLAYLTSLSTLLTCSR
jgi:hypothetical protein